jgi:hypothetical protein
LDTLNPLACRGCFSGGRRFNGAEFGGLVEESILRADGEAGYGIRKTEWTDGFAALAGGAPGFFYSTDRGVS